MRWSSSCYIGLFVGLFTCIDYEFREYSFLRSEWFFKGPAMSRYMYGWLLLIDFYCIEDKWMDSFLYFYSSKGAHVDYNSTIATPDSLSFLLLLGGTVLSVFVTYSVFRFIHSSLVCNKNITDHSIPKYQRYLFSYAPMNQSNTIKSTPLNWGRTNSRMRLSATLRARTTRPWTAQDTQYCCLM